MRRSALCILCGLMAASAAARQPDGTLGAVITPNNGVPAVQCAGGLFEVVIADHSNLSIHIASADGTRHAVEIAGRSESAHGRTRLECRIPPDVTPGTYAVEARDDARTVDRTARAVHVLDAFPEQYIVAHISDTHIGKEQTDRPPADVFRDVLASINESEPAFVLVTGDLTEGGAIEQFQRFLDVLDTCQRPTFVCPGNHDRLAQHYEHFFGPLTYTFRFGQDGYLAFDTKDYCPADELGRQDADLEIARRAIKRARWSIGFTHRYEPGMGMRSQITLFVDNPLDYLLFGHWHRANTEDEKTVPWGFTRISVVPAAFNGHLQLIDVAPAGIRPRPPEKVD
ncbi:MAG TPA: metallophosphoesterase [Candidatus Hydrogenedentes bacterium]|nr:metallophosphoesterase [Candidatus Hydrogenedentota bacterium]HPG68517.1 metallophosphoesterase [Candidatus Hydrogenedentota bacterium]